MKGQSLCCEWTMLNDKFCLRNLLLPIFIIARAQKKSIGFLVEANCRGLCTPAGSCRSNSPSGSRASRIVSRTGNLSRFVHSGRFVPEQFARREAIFALPHCFNSALFVLSVWIVYPFTSRVPALPRGRRRSRIRGWLQAARARPAHAAPRRGTPRTAPFPAGSRSR